MANYENTVLSKLYSRRVIGSHHKRLDTVMKMGWKAHEKGVVMEAVKSLLQRGLLIWAKKSHKAVTLNKMRIHEIKLLIGGDEPLSLLNQTLSN